jgi:malonyl-CoA/methylmalonyl-CoA synthetase
MLQVVNRAALNSGRTAIVVQDSEWTYSQLLDSSARLATVLLDGRRDLTEARVAFMAAPGFDYVRTLWAIWRAGGIAVPLCLSHPLPALRYVLEDTQADTLVASPPHDAALCETARELGRRLVHTAATDDVTHAVPLPDIERDRRATILYTSGTTNRPKGVVSTHANLEAQISTLVQAWRWRETDRTLSVLPLHHVHGLVNVVSCALWAGACCEFVREFAPDDVLRIFGKGRVSVFMAVPTIYYKLAAAWETLPAAERQVVSDRMRGCRLMVSGSAALPVRMMERWRAVSGQELLERYGMTEIGMALSNPIEGERRPGSVGVPLPGVGVRLVDEAGADVRAGEPGEILVRGAGVFLEYWNRPEVTREAFTPDGWFRTGDVAVVEKGYYRILGRNSTDIIKSGGYKISALELEEVLRTHPAIQDCGVVGIENDEWGEIVAAVLVPFAGGVDVTGIEPWIRGIVAPYKVPRRWAVVSELPRNAMGKVAKVELKSLFA